MQSSFLLLQIMFDMMRVTVDVNKQISRLFLLSDPAVIQYIIISLILISTFLLLAAETLWCHHSITSLLRGGSESPQTADVWWTSVILIIIMIISVLMTDFSCSSSHILFYLREIISRWISVTVSCWCVCHWAAPCFVLVLHLWCHDSSVDMTHDVIQSCVRMVIASGLRPPVSLWESPSHRAVCDFIGWSAVWGHQLCSLIFNRKLW